MKVFVTGASGHLGSAVVPELLGNGHEVVGLARSDSAATTLERAGAQIVRGDLADLDVLQHTASEADGVIHLAFDHDAMRANDFAGAAGTDLRAVQAIAAGLEQSGKPFVTTSGTLLIADPSGRAERPGTEDDVRDGGPRIDAENATVALAARGVRSSVVRLPPLVHSTLDDHGFGPTLIAIAREAGVSGYIGDGANRWPAVHTLDAARAYRLALEKAPAGTRLHAVGDEGVPLREIAAVIARHLGVPTRSIPAEEATEHFGYFAALVVLDNPAASETTRRELGWEPTGPGLLDDLDDGHYFAPAGTVTAGESP